MLLTEFPDLTWLRRQIAQRFRDQTAWNGAPAAAPGWPTVLLQVRTRDAERSGILGPFSLFLNVHNDSTVRVNGRAVRINDQAYIISNNGEVYDLEINGAEPTQTFNIHFGTVFYEQALHALRHDVPYLLDHPEEEPRPARFPFRTVFRDRRFNALLDRVGQVYGHPATTADERETALFDVFASVVLQNAPDLLRPAALSARKAATREEMLRRLYLSIDYIHSNLGQPLDLDELAAVACLSKFHFLRAFREAFRQTPYQYLTTLRLERALELLAKTDWPLALIAACVGLENGSSLSRLVRQRTGRYPAGHRRRGEPGEGRKSRRGG